MKGNISDAFYIYKNHFNSDYDLTLEKAITRRNVMILIKHLFNEKCLSKQNKKFCIVEPKFLKLLIIIRQAHRKSALRHYCHFLNKGFRFRPAVCYDCHDVLMMLIT